VSRPPIPANEDERLRALQECRILETPRELLFDGLTELAAAICNAPIALLSLIDRDRQWFKSSHGLNGFTETPRDVAFCAHAIASGTLFEVADASLDARFYANPLVVANPKVLFYAGMPLRNTHGHSLGSLCVMDHRPRRLNQAQRSALEHLARAAVALLEQRRVLFAAAEPVPRIEYWQKLVAEFGQAALREAEPGALMVQAVQLLSKTLEFECCTLLQVTEDGGGLALRASVGWPSPSRGRVVDPSEWGSKAQQVLANMSTIVTENRHYESDSVDARAAASRKFSVGIEAPIFGLQGVQGVLSVHTRLKRSVSPEILSFVQSVANFVGLSLARRQARYGPAALPGLCSQRRLWAE
jgi:GAF domain-containing protein